MKSLLKILLISALFAVPLAPRAIASDARCVLLGLETETAMTKAQGQVDRVLADWEHWRATVQSALDGGRQVAPDQWEERLESVSDAYSDLGDQAKILIRLKADAKFHGLHELMSRIDEVETKVSTLQVECLRLESTLESLTELSPSRKLSATEKSAITEFLTSRDLSLRAFTSVRCEGSVEVKGRVYPVFEVVASGSEGTVFAGLRQGEVVAVKNYTRSPELGVQRQVSVSRFLRRNGVLTPDILSSSIDEGRVVTRFVRGFTPRQMEARYRAGKISATEYQASKAAMEVTLKKLGELSQSPTLRRLLQETLFSRLDINPENFLYENDHWVMVDF